MIISIVNIESVSNPRIEMYGFDFKKTTWMHRNTEDEPWLSVVFENDRIAKSAITRCDDTATLETAVIKAG